MSCRIHPDLKNDLAEEAAFAELSTSNYVERILHNRHFNDSESLEDSEVLLEKIQHLEAELKAIQEEAIDEGKTDFSSEIELLQEQVENLQREKEELAEAVQYYKDLLEEREELISKNSYLNQQIDELSEKLDNETNNFPLNLDDLERMQLTSYLEDLTSYHPDASPTQLLLGSMDTTIRAEKSRWIIPTIKKFLKQSKTVEI